MRSRWNDAEAQSFAALSTGRPELGLRVYTSQLLGSEPALVLHGGGNTSVKCSVTAAGGHTEEWLFVKGSGADLAAARSEDFAAVRLEPVCRLISAPDMDNAALAAAVAQASVQAHGPKPSIETLLHAVLPWKYVEHTHADSVLAIVNTVNGETIAREVFGELAPRVPFRHSGFALAQAAHAVYREQAGPRSIGLILLHHGVFAFADGARESYENMLRLVTLAEEYLAARNAWDLPVDSHPFDDPDPLQMARLRADLSRHAGFPLLLRRLDGGHWQAYARRGDLAALCAQGPATPQHAVFIKREPMLGTDVGSYARAYERYVAASKPGRTAARCGLDPAPRVLIDPRLGVWAAGINEHYLGMTVDILRQDMQIKSRAAAHDRYRGLPAAAILDAEIHYGGFERRAHATGAPSARFLGEVVLLCVGSAEAALLRAGFEAQGATVADVAADGAAAQRPATIAQLTRRYGGVDIVVADAAVLPGLAVWLPVLGCAPRGGRLLALADAVPAALSEGCAQQGVRLVPGAIPRDALDVSALVDRCVALDGRPPALPAAGAAH